MKKKVVWLVVTGWLVAGLLLTACAPAAVKEEAEKVAPPKEKEEVVVPKEVVPEKETNLVKWTGKKLDGTVVEKMLEKPRYGGVYTYVRDRDPQAFDFTFLSAADAWGVNNMTNEELLATDWARGPGGTGEWDGSYRSFAAIGHETGMLAERWELADPGTFVFHIRKGIRYQDKPPLNGREVTAEDIAWSLRRNFRPGTYAERRTPFLVDMKNLENSIYVSPTDKWSVVVKFQPPLQAGPFYQTLTDHQFLVPREVVEKYGNMEDWRNVVGTGPFILKDYVVASALTYVRNPNYWKHDPFIPENQLPYPDGVKFLIIPDMSTRQAALRTGKVDMSGDPALEWEQAQMVLKTNPELQVFAAKRGSTPTIIMRMDLPEKPWADIRVRRALMMAVNQPEILKVYYEGKGVLSNYPIAPIAVFMDMFVPVEQMSQSIREQFEYHPDKAKKLLAEAGYPTGFKAEVITLAGDVDLLTIVKEYLAKVGVELEIAVKDPGTYTRLSSRVTYKDMLMGTMPSPIYPFTFTDTRHRSGANRQKIDDPKVEQKFLEVSEAFFDEPRKRQIFKDFVPYMKEQAWGIQLPAPDEFYVWQPWLKGFYGAHSVGHGDSTGHVRYIWLDQELKKAMGR